MIIKINNMIKTVEEATIIEVVIDTKEQSEEEEEVTETVQEINKNTSKNKEISMSRKILKMRIRVDNMARVPENLVATEQGRTRTL